VASNSPASTANTSILQRLLAHKDKFNINAQDAKSKKKGIESLQLNSLLPVELENEERQRLKQEKAKKGRKKISIQETDSSLANKMKQQYESMLSTQDDDVESGYTGRA
jgi:hypothetical protein